MKASELRIGNYYDNHGKIEQVSAATIEELWDAERSWCKPIKITDKLLFKLGLLPGWSYLEYRININDDVSMAIWLDESRLNNCHIGDDLEINIKYVHQLQNLYYVLTNEELTL